MHSAINAPITLNPGERITCEDCGKILPDGPNSYINHLTSAATVRPGYIYISSSNIGMFKGNIPLLFQRNHELRYRVAGRAGCLANFNANVRKYNANIPLPLSDTFKRADPRFSPTGLDYMLSGERRVPDMRPGLPPVEYDAIDTAIQQVPEDTPLEMLSADMAFLYMRWPDVESEADQTCEQVRSENEAEMNLWKFTEWGDFEVPAPTNT